MFTQVLPRPSEWPFVLLVVACGLAGMGLASTPLAHAWGLGALALALLIGLLVTQPLPAAWRERAAPSLNLFKGPVLKTAIVLYGLRIPLDAVAGLGVGVLVLDAVQVLASLLLAAWLGPVLFRMPRNAALLIGAGNGICGAAAVLAAEPLLRGRDRDGAMAVAAVVVFGTLNMLLLPVMFHRWPGLFGDPADYALFTGATVQEVAQVLVAAQAMSPALVDTALLVKMARVMMLAPVLMGLALLARGGDGGTAGRRLPVPPFALLFALAMAVNGLGLLPDGLRPALAGADDLLLTLAMAALGLSTHLGLLRQAGWRPLALGALLWALLLAVAGAALISGLA
ncbi:MAG: YeiH family putative sulfate export transporter [Alcanivorax sp.]|nr:YeiH family putative sulfate export transporter [Alcanivorax sp.]MBI53204.1 YeiH family putative sulfate export transporter [Alcanivorax sp.]MBU58552.1 YeiH family putative sulfate export transporter [Alcanivorax sp.]UWN48759.1 hypothetical protein ASALC70_00947 [Alcanivorax sp. ALC70]HCE39657.1 YeiH family putative sulfate export transporter [Alcanivorax sp.]|tara:strand:+ start:48600 stop:49622 length:1023 start_codon:yes stop_codon:yes gene_type:complete